MLWLRRVSLLVPLCKGSRETRSRLVDVSHQMNKNSKNSGNVFLVQLQ
jgi:hypothetical protein